MGLWYRARVRARRRRRRESARPVPWPHFAPEYVHVDETTPRGAASGEASDSDAEEAPEDEPLQAFDLYKALGVTKTAKGVAGGRNRCFAAFHSRALRADPERFRGADAYDAGAWLKFRRLALAYVVLSDGDRRAVFDRVGFENLRASEELAQVSAFDLDPIGVFDDFFDARDAATGDEDAELKEYLLLSAADDESDPASSGDEREPPAGGEGVRAAACDDAPPRPSPQASAGSTALLGLVGPRPPEYPGARAWARLQGVGS